jgi:hypothetical protein
MLTAIRRAWRAYLASIPKPDEHERIFHEQIVREYFRPPPVSPKDRSAFDALADLIVAHLPEGQASSKAQRLKAKLKPGVDPVDALSDWIRSNCDPKSRVGVVALDWKAREEVHWQAVILAKAHGVSLAWDYDCNTDTEWKNWQERTEFPVDTPLKILSRALMSHEVVLYRFSVDDAVYAFAVALVKHDAVKEHCASLGIEVASEI